MAESKHLSPGAAHLVGLLLIATGVLPALAAFDLGPLRREDIDGPPWLAIAAGCTFAGAGAALIAGVTSPLAARCFGLLAVGGLASIGNWIAFGIGERACSGSFDLSGLGCRIPFGVGALACNGFLCLMVATTLQQALGGPPRLARLVKGAEWLLFASLAPILLPLLLFGIGGAALDALKARLKTGAWPRNEAFIARQQARREAARDPAAPPDHAT